MKDCAEVAIDDKTIELLYDFNNLVDAEPVTGINLLSALGNLNGGMTGGQLRGLIYAMIIPPLGFPKEPVEQLKWCGKLIRIDTMGDLIYGIGEACAIAISQEYAEQYKATVKEATAAMAAAASGDTEAPAEEPVVAAA